MITSSMLTAVIVLFFMLFALCVSAAPDISLLLSLEVWSLGSSSMSFSMLVDFTSLAFSLTVALISMSVFIFSSYYVCGIPNYTSFHLILFVFVLSMLMLIFSPNVISLMLGWDGLGISSYFLVIFYKSSKALNSGLLTGISNRVGDALILISLAGIFSLPHTSLIPSQASGVSVSGLVSGVLIIAACTKSAQLPFSAWLPAAMAAPTPVSALVHSSTLVTAGVYLVIRMQNWAAVSALNALSWLGGLTMLMASLSALSETDGKKIVALSTLSQLGVMMCGAGMNNTSVMFFHLLVHAFFKALLFIATGVAIHNAGDSQDLRGMSGLYSLLPMTKTAMVFTNLSLMGLPFFAAFYSKEMILEGLGSANFAPLFTYSAMLVGVSLTVGYSVRFIYYILFTGSRNSVSLYLSEASLALWMSVFLLSLPSVLSGKLLFFMLSDFMVSPLLSSSSKLVPMVLILISVPGLILLPSRAIRGPMKYFGFMWGLANFAGGLTLNSGALSGTHAASLLSFSTLDYMLLSWKSLPITSSVAITLPFSAQLFYLLLPLFMLIMSLGL